MKLVTVTAENLEKEHICCAISNNDDCQVAAKKKWMSSRFADGLTFIKGDVRGKCFIEYIPADKAWAPVTAKGYAYVDCLWVSGQYKGQGNSNLLLEACIKDCKSKGLKGLVALTATKKLPFLADPKFLEHKGFLIADSAEPYFRLAYFPFSPVSEKPFFNDSVKEVAVPNRGYVIYYTSQCPYTAKYVPLLGEVAKRCGVDIEIKEIVSTEATQNAPTPFTTFSLFHNGKFVTHEILSEKRFEAIINAGR